MERDVHPVCALFPMMAEAELRLLAADIQQNGLQDPVMLDSEGRVADGRNRLAACEIAGVEPCTDVLDPHLDATTWIISKNLYRRHLTDSQRAMVAAKLASLPHGGDRKSDNAPIPAAPTQAKAAEMLGVSERNVQFARKVIEEHPDQVAAVESGEKTVRAALRDPAQAHRPPPKQEPPPEPAVDSLGNELPPHVAEAIAQADRLKELVNEAHSLRRRVEEMCKDPLGSFINRQQVETDLKNAAAGIRFAIPYCICPYCWGDKCKACRQQGWVPEEIYGQSPEGLKKK